MNRTVAILDDFLRDEPNGLVHHVTNRRWLAAMAQSLAGEAFAVREFGFDVDGAGHLDVADFMAALDLECGPAGWAAAWAMEPSDRFVALLGERLEGVAIVAGFGLPNVVAVAVDRLGMPLIDVEMSPFRFQPDLDIDARTNVRALAESPLLAVPDARLRTAATAVRGWCARHAADVIPAGAGRVGVVFGQTEVDASLIDAGRLSDVAAHADAVRNWAEGLDHVLFRPHPYAATAAAFDGLVGILPTARPTRIGSYMLLASPRVDRFLAISSSILDEAVYFDAASRATRLVSPKRRSGRFHYSLVASLDVLSAAVLTAVREGAPIPATAMPSYALRQQFAISWGLPLEATPSDFHAPEPLVGPEPPASPEPAAEPPPEGIVTFRHGPDPVVTPPVAPPPVVVRMSAAARRRLPVRRKIVRELARLRRQAWELLGIPEKPAAEQPAPTAEPPFEPRLEPAADRGPEPLPKTLPEPLPAEPVSPEPVSQGPGPSGSSAAHGGSTETAKDFSYASGERQVSVHYFLIRRDHRARYELAARLVPRPARVLDLFCGNGYGSFVLSDRRDVLGIDGSAEAIAVARRHYARLGARFETRQFPFADDTRYDAVVSFESLEHVDDGPGFFRFLVDRVVPGGLLFFSTPNQDLLPFDPAIHVHHRRHFTLAETLALAASHAVTIRSWFGQNVYRLDAAAPVPLHPSMMELHEREPGQFTVVVAEKLPG